MLKQKLILLLRKKISFFCLFLIFLLFFFSSLFLLLLIRKNLKKQEKAFFSSSVILVKKPVPLLEKELTILLLGLDSRIGDQRPRCDAIHLLTFSPAKEKIIITSVPRGTAVLMAGVATPSAYLGNSCHIKGFDFAIEEIKKITALKPDYVIKVNFSQVLGILRFLGFPPTPTLQFLRDRKSFYWGDYQRTHNQALFLKDGIINYSQKIHQFNPFLKKTLFKTVNVQDLDYQTAEKILNWIIEKKIFQKPSQIELVIKPPILFALKDIHFQESGYAAELNWQEDPGFKTYQKNLIDFLQSLIKQANDYLQYNHKAAAFNLLETPFSQSPWLQIEDNHLRNQLHFELLKVYLLSLDDKDKSRELIDDFAKEMERENEKELKIKAEEFKNELN